MELLVSCYWIIGAGIETGASTEVHDTHTHIYKPHNICLHVTHLAHEDISIRRGSKKKRAPKFSFFWKDKKLNVSWDTPPYGRILIAHHARPQSS